MITTVLTVLFLLATAYQIYFWWVKVAPLAWYKAPKGTETKGPPVSVIICARNEEENLKKNLPRILNQNYHSFEVIVVNDGSTDQTQKVLLDNQKSASILRIVTLENEDKTTVGKKFALSKGIEKSKNELLLLTDADCCPLTDDWIQKMQETIRGDVEIGFGYSPYERRSGSLNLFIRFETVLTAIQYLSFALAGMPYMGVGRNLIYKKSLFERVGGFKAHEHIASGDDDLFVNAAANSSNTAIIIDPDTFTVSTPKTTCSAYIKQKTRHLTTGENYLGKHKRVLGALAFSHFYHYLGGIMLLNSSMIFVILTYMARMMVIMFVCRPLYPRLHARDIWKWIPILDVAYLLYYPLFFLAKIFRKTERWN
ncbi:MAG: glycosyltransferase [Saprospiraceae bacterium]|nr:glycosyltransferase [Saprospiraceae bacterium]